MAIVMLTGAAGGIGAATARRLAAQNHRLVLIDRDAQRLATLAATLQTPVLTVTADVTDPAAIAQAVSAAVAHFGGIDVLVNNAGVGQGPLWWDHPPAAIVAAIATNLTAPLLATQAVLPTLLQQRRGHIINVSSIAGHLGVFGLYSAAKYGLRGHTHALRRELSRSGIAVSLLSPGFVRTDMTKDLPFPMPAPEIVAAAIARLVARPRKEVVVPRWYWGLIWLHRLAPWLVDALFKGRFASDQR